MQLRKLAFVLGVTVALSACAVQRPTAQAYWQRVEDKTSAYMTGPKAQQQLTEDIASCTRQVDELVELDALRGGTPADTHSDYSRALKASGDLDYYDTPTRFGDKKVAHKDFHDFESCMRHMGWERVKFVKYETALKAQKDYDQAQLLRQWGAVPGQGGETKALQAKEKAAAEVKKEHQAFNS